MKNGWIETLNRFQGQKKLEMGLRYFSYIVKPATEQNNTLHVILICRFMTETYITGLFTCKWAINLSDMKKNLIHHVQCNLILKIVTFIVYFEEIRAKQSMRT